VSEEMAELMERVLEVVRRHGGQPVSVGDIAGELLAPPDRVYRAVALLIADKSVVPVVESIERELELV